MGTQVNWIVLQPPQSESRTENCQVSEIIGSSDWKQDGRLTHQAVRGLEPVLDQQLDGAAGGKVPVCLEACASRLHEAAADGDEVVAVGSAAAS